MLWRCERLLTENPVQLVQMVIVKAQTFLYIAYCYAVDSLLAIGIVIKQHKALEDSSIILRCTFFLFFYIKNLF